MKKAKIMLSAILALAIVSGALAFKAKHFQTFTFYKTDPAGTQHFCTLSVILPSTTVGAIATAPYSTTTVAATTCTTFLTASTGE